MAAGRLHHAPSASTQIYISRLSLATATHGSFISGSRLCAQDPVASELRISSSMLDYTRALALVARRFQFLSFRFFSFLSEILVLIDFVQEKETGVHRLIKSLQGCLMDGAPSFNLIGSNKSRNDEY